MDDAITRVSRYLTVRDTRRAQRERSSGYPDLIMTAVGPGGPADLTESDLRAVVDLARRAMGGDHG